MHDTNKELWFVSIGGQIPDANMIHIIRKQRQQRRDLGDFIPVDDTVKVQSSSSKSRLIR